MYIIKAYALNNLCYKAAQKMTPKGIVVHSTGANNPYLKRYVDAPDQVGINQYGNHWNQPKPDGRKVCVHAFIGYDKDKEVRVAEILPLDICCWGVGSGSKGSYNYNPAYIQFEICEDKLTDKVYYKKAFSVAAEYCAELCRFYSISADKIVGYCEAYRLGYGSNHSDPEHWMKNFGETMDDFRKLVSEILKSNNKEKEKSQETASENNSIVKGDLVSITSNATYYNDKSVPDWVKNQNWYLSSKPVGDRVVVDKNEKGTNSICSPISKEFLTVVKKADSSVTSEPMVKANASSCPYLIKVITDCLYIHKDAGTNSVKVGSITDNGVYTIVEEKNGTGASKWGKLKSGAGWISIDNTKKFNYVFNPDAHFQGCFLQYACSCKKRV